MSDRALSAQAEVEELLAGGSSFEHVEAYIERRRDLTAESRSALWLWAWAETSREERRRVTREMLEQAQRGEFRVAPRRLRRVVSPVRRR